MSSKSKQSEPPARPDGESGGGRWPKPDDEEIAAVCRVSSTRSHSAAALNRPSGMNTGTITPTACTWMSSPASRSSVPTPSTTRVRAGRALRNRFSGRRARGARRQEAGHGAWPPRCAVARAVRTSVTSLTMGLLLPGRRYCMNSAALRFIPKLELEREGYGEYLRLFSANEEAGDGV